MASVDDLDEAELFPALLPVHVGYLFSPRRLLEALSAEARAHGQAERVSLHCIAYHLPWVLVIALLIS